MTNEEMKIEFLKNVYSSRDIRLADPKWLGIWPQLKEDYGMETGLCLEISCTYRSPKAQNDIYERAKKAGIWLTDFDGINKLSKHNIYPSPAIDTFVHLAGKIIWKVEVFEPLGILSKKYGLIWGGNWKKKDRPHLELENAVTNTINT